MQFSVRMNILLRMYEGLGLVFKLSNNIKKSLWGQKKLFSGICCELWDFVLLMVRGFLGDFKIEYEIY